MNLFNTLLEFVVGLFSRGDVEVSIPIGKDAPEAPKAETKPEEPAKVKIILTHNRFCSEGIFGQMAKEGGGFICYTLEHSYDNKPKLADGTYTCVRGPHRLDGMTEDFITFEIKGIPDFNGKSVTGVLFHWGNWDKDSEGCVLMGSTETLTMIGNSRKTWADFMDSMAGIDSFELQVVSN